MTEPAAQAQGGTLRDPRTGDAADKFWAGVLLAPVLAVLCPAAAGLLFYLSSPEAAVYVAGALFFAMGLSQILWMGPLLAYAHWSRRPDLTRGLAAGAGLVFLINAGCWGRLMLMR